MRSNKGPGKSIFRRFLFLALLTPIITVGAIAGVNAVSDTDVFNGQVAAGDHDWWQDQGAGAFCERCHQGVVADITAGPHNNISDSDCSFCHTPGGADHAAAPAQCTDCHGDEGTALGADAHAGILTDLGETAGSASQSCQSCHTHVSVNVTATPQAPLELIMGG